MFGRQPGLSAYIARKKKSRMEASQVADLLGVDESELVGAVYGIAVPGPTLRERLSEWLGLSCDQIFDREVRDAWTERERVSERVDARAEQLSLSFAGV